MPHGYDHKYIYSHFGYNLKPLDLQAAIGRVQLQRLPDFIELRKKNWNYLRNSLSDCADVFHFSLPTHALDWSSNNFTWDGSECQSYCSWFGFMIRIKSKCGLSRSKLAQALDQAGIGNRMFFGGNLLRQPLFVDLINKNSSSVRVIGSMVAQMKL